ncbi:MAG: toxin [Labilithrix sp.]|nr:toxin [Labilithrix sp.]
MTKLLAIPGLLALLALGCSSADDGTGNATTSSDEVVSFNPDRTRTCATACAEGTVCDDAVHACVAEPGAPQLRFPISGAVTSGLPALSWTSGAAASESVVEICQDASCAHPVAELTAADGATLATALPRGTYFVRAWGVRNEPDGHVVAAATATKPRVFRSNGRPVASSSALGWFADEGDDAALTAGGLASAGPLLVPDMDGDGRTEIVAIRPEGSAAKLVISRLDAGAQVVDTKLDVSAQAKLLLLGDVDRDGYFDIGSVQDLADGVRLEIVFGGPVVGARRKTVDVRMPAENGKPTELASVSAIGDLDGDGYPELALGGRASTTDAQWGATIPRAGVFSDGPSDADRFYVYRGAAAQPFTQAMPVFRSEGTASGALVPLGDVDGDGVMDAIGLESSPSRLVEYEADEYSTNHWNKVGRGVRPPAGFVVLGGSPLRKKQIRTPSYWREGPAATWAYGPALIGQYDEVQGIRTIASGRAREEFFFAVSVAGVGDWDADGFADLAFGMAGAAAPAPLSGESWDAFSDASVVRDYVTTGAWGGSTTTTWHRFAAFVEARYGGASGPGDAPAQRIQSPTLASSPGLVPWVVFPARIEARTSGLFLAEARGALHTNPPYFTAFEGTFAGPPGGLVLRP